MRNRIVRRPSAPLIVAILALVVAMGGSAVAVVAAQNGDSLISTRSLSGNRLRLNTVTGREVAESTLRIVPKATLAQRLPQLVWHTLDLINDWVDYNETSDRKPAWALDAQGVVHFRGGIKQAVDSGNTFAVLPDQIIPALDVYVATTMNATAPGRLHIANTGAISTETNPAVNASIFTSLDGVTYSVH